MSAGDNVSINSWHNHDNMYRSSIASYHSIHNVKYYSYRGDEHEAYLMKQQNYNPIEALNIRIESRIAIKPQLLIYKAVHKLHLSFWKRAAII